MVATDHLTTPHPCGMRDYVIPLAGCVFFYSGGSLRVTAQLRYSVCTNEECSTGLVRFQASVLSIRGRQGMCVVNEIYVPISSVELAKV